MRNLHLEKQGIRGLAIAESFSQTSKKSVLSGIVMSTDLVIDGFVFGHSTVGGDDATDTILSMYEKLDRPDVSFLLISGIVISLYNIVDVKRISEKTDLPVIGVPILVYNDKQQKKSAFGGLDSLLSISEMPSGSPVVTVGVNKALNAGIYALKILANESSSIQKMLKSHKEKQHKSVLKESQDLKRMGLKKFVKKKFK